MNILRKTVGFLTAAAIAAGSVIPLAASADSTAAEDVTNENVILLDEQENDVTEETEVAEIPAADDEEEYAEEYAKLHDDPQYGKYLKAKTLYNSLGENDFSALRSVGGTEDGEGMVSLGKYSNNKLVHNSKFDDMDKIYGIDVSYFQYDIDWSKVKNDVDFAIIRVGYRGYGESGDLVLDYKFKENIKEAKAAGLEVGVYFYTQAITPAEAREEADYVYKYIKNYELELPVYFDIESVDWDSGRLDNADLTVAERTKLCRAFCNRMISYGYESGVYANMNWLNNLIDGKLLGSKYPIWLANYTNQTEYDKEYQTWQFSSTGKISGISTNVDMNVDYRVPTTKVTLPKPKNIKMTVSAGQATFTCDPVEGANKYVLYSYDDSTASYTKLTSSYQNSITVPLTDSYLGYVLRGVDTTGETMFLSPYSDKVYAQKGMPANFAVEESTGGAVKVSWDKLDEAEGYVVYRAKGADGAFTKYRTLGPNSCSIRETGLAANTCYGYKAVPLVNGAEGVATKEKWYITEVGKVSGLRSVAASSETITLGWNGVSGVSGYEIAQYDATNSKYIKKAVVNNGVTGVVSSLSPKTEYRFAVRAYTEIGGQKRYGDYSAILTASTILTAPQNLYAKASSSGVKLTWNKVSGAQTYRVYRKTGTAFERIATDLTANSYTDTTAPTVRTVYTVKAIYSVNGKLAASGNAKKCAVNAVPAKPFAYAIRATKSRIRIGWDAVSGCSGYRIYMYNDYSGKYEAVKTIKNPNTVSFAASGLYSNTKYKFKVRPYKKGVNGICWGKCSNVVSVWTYAY